MVFEKTGNIQRQFRVNDTLTIRVSIVLKMVNIVGVFEINELVLFSLSSF